MTNHRILVIDDDAVLRNTLSDILQTSGYETLAARDGFEGLALLAENPCNIVLLDLRLPDLPGIDVLERVKAEYPAIETIILTGNATLDSAMEATNRGAFSYLVKPYEVEQLLLHIRRAIEKGEAAEELKATHAQMLRKEKMAAIGQLSAGIAHEINNPLAFILSNLRTLGRYADRVESFLQAQSEVLESMEGSEKFALLEEKRKELKLDFILKDMAQLVEESRDGAERVEKIVKELKAFSRVDEAEWKAADINECLESTLHIVWNELKYKAEVTREYGKLPLVRCNPGQLNQVFMNLLVNAAHAIEKFGTIRVRSRRSGGGVQVDISDTGCGIPEAIRERIFDPFFTTKDARTGTGLGLSISYDIVKQHGGEMHVESRVGEGTTFSVILPPEGG